MKIEIAVDSAFSKKIASTESLSLLASKLAYSPISDLIVAVGTGPASQKVVQEDIKEIKFTFKTTSVIPGTSNGFNQAVHLFLPRTFDKSSQVASASASCTFGDGSNVAIAVDESGIYAENC